MRRALLGTLAGSLFGAGGLFAQSPLPPIPPSQVNPARPAASRVGPAEPQRTDLNRGHAPQAAGMGAPSYGPVTPHAQASNPQPSAPQLLPAGAMLTTQSTLLPQPTPVPQDGRMAPIQPPTMGHEPRIGPMAPATPYSGYPTPLSPSGPEMIPGGPAWNGLWNGCGDNCWGQPCGDCGPWSRCPWGPCGPEGRMWASVDLLLWWTRGHNLPPLLTRGTGPANPGILGQPGTTIIFGNAALGESMRVGVRPRVGLWIDECQTLGIEGSFFYLGQVVDEFCFCFPPGDVISRPFFNTDPEVNGQDAELVALPGVLAGCVKISATSEFYGADANLRRNLCCNCNSRIDVIGGFRYAHLSDSLAIVENLTNLDPQRGVVGEGYIVRDSFRSVNNFYGGQFGLAGEFRSGNIFVDWRALCALGATHHVIFIDGSTTFVDAVTPLPTVTQPGGLLAQPSNIGRWDRSSFSVVPEVGVNLGYAVAPGLRLYVGYTFLYWNNVARAAEQINLRVDGRQLPSRAGPGTGTDPEFILQRNDFWAQGINFGLQLRY